MNQCKNQEAITPDVEQHAITQVVIPKVEEYTPAQAVVPRVNREYKDTLFRMIFKDKKKLLNLFNAVNYTQYTDDDVLEIKTLENAIYMNLKNDISLLIDCEIHFYAHQSTLNPNIPLRELHYFSRTMERELGNRSLYSSTLRKIPTPRFFMFYNGLSEEPDQKELRLSDAFQKPVDNPDLELKVTMLNINHGKNHALMEQCKELKDYAIYIAKIREYAQTYNIQTAVEYATDECIQEGILAEFLRKNRAEAIAMSIFEYDEEKEMKLIRADERKAGEEIGRIEGEKAGRIYAKRIFKLHIQGKTPEEIANICNIAIKEVLAILE